MRGQGRFARHWNMPRFDRVPCSHVDQFTSALVEFTFGWPRGSGTLLLFDTLLFDTSAKVRTVKAQHDLAQFCSAPGFVSHF
jgi:hypothetical protein